MRMLRVTPAEDGTLVERARAGDREAFGELYEQYVGRVYRYLLYMAKDVDVAQDLTEQMFLQALAAISRYERRGVPFVAWLLRIAHNLHLNGRRVRPRNSSRREEEEETDRGSPELSCEARANAEELMQAVQGLTKDQRQVIILRFVERTELRGYCPRDGQERGGRESGPVSCSVRPAPEARGWRHRTESSFWPMIRMSYLCESRRASFNGFFPFPASIRWAGGGRVIVRCR